MKSTIKIVLKEFFTPLKFPVASIILSVLIILLISYFGDKYIYHIINKNPSTGFDSLIRVIVPSILIFQYYIYHTIKNWGKYLEVIDRDYKGGKTNFWFIIKTVCIPMLLVFYINSLNVPDVPESMNWFDNFIGLMSSLNFFYYLIALGIIVFTLWVPSKIRRDEDLPVLDLILWVSAGLIGPFVIIGVIFSGVYGCYSAIGLSSGEALKSIDYVYFSFVTLTTLGYGEILPTTITGKYVVILKSIVGIFYMGVALSITLSTIISNQRKPE